MSKPVYWLGTVNKCDVSGAPFDGVMYDANLGQGWGNVCQKVFDEYGCTLGTGRGQKYEQQEDGRWLKTAG